MLKRILLSLLIAPLLALTSRAAGDPFIGKWKLNPDKTVLTDEIKVSPAGQNRYGFVFGGDAPELIVADGTDQPALNGTTLAVTMDGPNTWKVLRKKDGKVLINAIWTLSDDGKTLHIDFTGYQPNSSPLKLDYRYSRTAGNSGFSGTWDTNSEKVHSAVEIEVEPYEGDGLSFINRAQQSTKALKFDGKDYPVQGPNLSQNLVTSGRRLNESTLELTDKIEGKVRDTQQIQISPDGKTLTITVKPVSLTKPNILLFDRE